MLSGRNRSNRFFLRFFIGKFTVRLFFMTKKKKYKTAEKDNELNDPLTPYNLKKSVVILSDKLPTKHKLTIFIADNYL